MYEAYQHPTQQEEPAVCNLWYDITQHMKIQSKAIARWQLRVPELGMHT